MLSGPTVKYHVAAMPRRSRIVRSLGTPSRVPEKVSTSMRRATGMGRQGSRVESVIVPKIAPSTPPRLGKAGDFGGGWVIRFADRWMPTTF